MVQRIAEGATSIYPAGLVLGIVTGTEGTKLRVAIGEYNKMIDARMAEINAANFVDGNGHPLDGSKAYKVHLPPNVPANNFWSFTAYDSQSRSMLQTDQQFPAVGSLTKGIVANADKSFDV